jgi:hypothetical protein
VDGTPFDFPFWLDGEPNGADIHEYCAEVKLRVSCTAKILVLYRKFEEEKLSEKKLRPQSQLLHQWAIYIQLQI